MKVKVTAIISLLSGIGWGGFTIFFMIENGIDEDSIGLFAVLISAISVILYVIWTRFGEGYNFELYKLKHKNQILKMKIEQKELEKKLGEQN